MLTIAAYVLMSVISITQAFVMLDANKMHREHHEEPQSIESASPQEDEGCVHDDGEIDEGHFI